MRVQHRHNREKGAVSLFVVIFTALLFVAVTVGFTVLMLSDQQQSTDNDLAQSALDSANAGTEDAKRVLAQYADCVERNNNAGVCRSIRNAVDNGECNTLNAALGSPDSTEEREIQQTESDSEASEALQQAYTCVKIAPNTNTYIGQTRGEDDIRLIPLKTDGEVFDTVQVNWLKREDMELEDRNPNFEPIDPYPGTETGIPEVLPLPARDEWRNEDRGAILRVGSMQYSPGRIDVNAIDAAARAVFLYPNDNLVVNETIDLSDDALLEDMHRPLPPVDQSNLEGKYVNTPIEVRCEDDPTRTYLCTTSFRLPNSADGSLLRYLTLASVYRSVSFEISLLDSSRDPVQFKNVQPEIDVTGRANDIFRRVVSRVEAADANEAPYPRAALGTTDSICKDFIITDSPDDGDFTDNAAKDYEGICPPVNQP